MPRTGGHNQASFIKGIRNAGPDPENHFDSAKVLSNYDVLPSGHIRRRRGLTEVVGNIGFFEGRTIKDVIPFAGDYLYLMSDEKVYYQHFRDRPITFNPFILKSL